MDATGLRTGNYLHFDSFEEHWKKINSYDIISISIKEETKHSYRPIEITEEILKKKFAIALRQNKGGVEIRKARLQVGFVFCYRKAALKFIRYVHEFQNLYFDLKGRFPEMKA